MQQSPRWLQWDAPNSPSKLPRSLQRAPPHLIHPSFDRLHSPPKRHPDPVSRFATVHTPDRHTHRQTDTWGRRQVYSRSAYTLYYIDSKRGANKNSVKNEHFPQRYNRFETFGHEECTVLPACLLHQLAENSLFIEKRQRTLTLLTCHRNGYNR